MEEQPHYSDGATLKDLSEQYDTLEDIAVREGPTLEDLSRAVITSNPVEE